MRDLIRNDYPVLSPRISSNMVRRQMHRGCCVLMQDGDYLGLLCERDLAINPKILAWDCMRPLPMIDANSQVEEAFSLFESTMSNFLPVMVNGQFIGVLSACDLFRSKYAKSQQECDAKSSYLAEFSHEIRTPLSIITGLAELITLEDPANRNSEYLAMLKSTAEHIRIIANSVLDISEIEENRVTLENRPVSIMGLVSKLDCLASTSTDDSNVYYSCHVDTQLPEKIFCDGNKVVQILINLLRNAFKYTDNGYVRLDITPKANGTQICFCVSDTGIGIPEESRHLLFQKHRRLHENRPGESSGLGLFLCKRFAKALGGKLSHEPNSDKGSIFIFEMPLIACYPTQHQNIEVMPSRAQRQSELRVLLAEDNPICQKVTANLLRSIGCHVTPALDGAIAVQLCHETAFDLIFMDCQMPNMNGFVATKTLREMGVETPIIGLTGDVLKEHIEHCIHSGMNSHLCKPINSSALIETIEFHT